MPYMIYVGPSHQRNNQIGVSFVQDASHGYHIFRLRTPRSIETAPYCGSTLRSA
jgi:hypothetical protein